MSSKSPETVAMLAMLLENIDLPWLDKFSCSIPVSSPGARIESFSLYYHHLQHTFDISKYFKFSPITLVR